MNFSIPKTPRSTTKSIRFPNEVIDQVNDAIAGTDCDFTKFVVAAVRSALVSLEEQKSSD